MLKRLRRHAAKLMEYPLRHRTRPDAARKWINRPGGAVRLRPGSGNSQQHFEHRGQAPGARRHGAPFPALRRLLPIEASYLRNGLKAFDLSGLVLSKDRSVDQWVDRTVDR